MSKKSSILYLVVLACAVFTAVTVATADFRALAQNSNSSTTDPSMAQNTNASGDISGDQTDLSGTYTGKLKMTGSHEMEGDGTITITGNNVTIEAAGMTHTGRIFAVTTRGYTGVTMAFPDIQDTVTNTNLIVMARARKRGTRLWLTPVPSARNVIAFR